MTITTLYKYQQKNGTVIVSPEKPSCLYELRYRLVADEGKVVTKDGTNLYSVIDTDGVAGFYEVDAPIEEPEEILEATE